MATPGGLAVEPAMLSSRGWSPRLRFWRRVLRGVACLLGLLALLALGVVAILHSLDRPWIKRHLLGAVARSAGVELDYRAARVDAFSGAVVEGVCVRSPAEVRAFTPDVVCVDHVTASWSLRSLFGAGPRLRELRVAGVTMTVVVDEHGRTSFDALAPPRSTPQPRTAVPLSRLASTLLATAPPIAKVDLDDVSLVLIRTEHAEVSDRLVLRGIALSAEVKPTAPMATGWRVDVQVGAPDDPLALVAERTHAGRAVEDARARLWISAAATPTASNVALDLHVVDQTFAPTVSVADALHAEAGARFEPSAGRTEITLDHVVAGDGAAHADATIEVPDAGDPVVRSARGDMDVAQLLRWLPADLMPAKAEQAHLRWQADDLVVGEVPRLGDRGSLRVDADLSNVSIDAAGARGLVDRGALSLQISPAERGTLAAHGTLEVGGARIASGGVNVAAEDMKVNLDGAQAGEAMTSGHVGVTFSRLEVAGSSALLARDGDVELRAENLRPDVRAPLATTGDLTVSIGLGSLEAQVGTAGVTADGVRLRAHTTRGEKTARAVEVDAPAARVRVVRGDGKALLDGPAHVEVKATDLRVDLARPLATRGVFHANLQSEGAQAAIDATKDPDSVDYRLRAAAPSLGVLRAFLSPALLARAPWERIGVTLRSDGKMAGLGGPSPSLRQSAEVDVEHPAFDGLTATSLSLTLKSEGTSLSHRADVDVAAPGLSVDGGPPSDDHLSLSTTVDRSRGAMKFELSTRGRATTAVSGSVAFDAARRALVYAIDARLAGLAPLARLAGQVPGLDAFDLSELEVALSTKGALLGVVANVARDGTIALEPSAAASAALEGQADLRVSHLRWAKGDTGVVSPALSWHGVMRVSGPERTLESRIEAGTLHLDLGRYDVDLNGVAGDGRLSMTGDWSDPHVDVTQRLSVGVVTQNALPEYPIGDLTLAVSAQRNPGGIVHVSEAKVANGLGATALAVKGNIDLGEGRRSLALTTSLTQDLEQLSRIPARFTGRGRVGVEANVASPDLSLFALHAVVKGEGVTFSLPRQRVEIDTASGEVPIALALTVGDGGVKFARTGRRDPYSMLRFADQHPLLTHSGFLSIGRLTAPFVSIAPLVGNLEIEQNVVSLRQFEMGIRGGTITGQCGLDWDGPRSTLELHVRASGVQSSHGEPFDGNVSVVVSAADRTVEGRAEILHIGERHLLDLLDLQDPLHVDPAINRIRTALHFGYPDRLRLVFDHGFASAHLELGGLARLISIGEVRGIPVGPIVDKTIGSLLEEPDPKESP